MDETLLTSRVCTALMRIGTRMATGFDQEFAAHGITQAQFRVLLAIWEEGGADGIAPSALAEHLLLERGTISVLTQRMAAHGWIARQPGANRRTIRLVLTAAGGQLLQSLVPRAIALADRTLAGLSPDQLRQLSGSLELVEAQLRAAAQPEEEEA